MSPRPRRLALHELDIFLGKNYVITYHIDPLPILDRDRDSIERDPRDRMRHGADHLLVRFLELAIDQSLRAIEQLDEQVDAIQNAVIENATPRNLKAIFRIKRSAIQLHKILSPQREVLNRLAAIRSSRFSPSTGCIFATCTTMSCGFTTSRKAFAT